MKQVFLYNDETEAAAGDICFYSEYDGENRHYHYADSICEIADVDGVLKIKTHVFTMTEGRSFEYLNEPERQMPELRFAQNSEGYLKHLTKIGTRGTDDHMLTTEYAESNYLILEN